jgi:hypothetical protein
MDQLGGLQRDGSVLALELTVRHGAELVENERNQKV